DDAVGFRRPGDHRRYRVRSGAVPGICLADPAAHRRTEPVTAVQDPLRHALADRSAGISRRSVFRGAQRRDRIDGRGTETRAFRIAGPGKRRARLAADRSQEGAYNSLNFSYLIDESPETHPSYSRRRRPYGGTLHQAWPFASFGKVLRSLW